MLVSQFPLRSRKLLQLTTAIFGRKSLIVFPECMRHTTHNDSMPGDEVIAQQAITYILDALLGQDDRVRAMYKPYAHVDHQSNGCWLVLVYLTPLIYQNIHVTWDGTNFHFHRASQCAQIKPVDLPLTPHSASNT